MSLKAILLLVSALLLSLGSQASAQPAPPPGTRGLNFDTAPEPDYRTLLRLYMASNADILRNPAFAWENMITFHAGESSAAQNMAQDCFALTVAQRNEFERNRILERAFAWLNADLASAASLPKTQVFKLRQRTRLGNYDPASRSFPITPSIVPVLGDYVVVARNTLLANYGYGGPTRALCGTQPTSGSNMLPGRETLPSYRGSMGIGLKYQPRNEIASVPMAPADADAFLARQVSANGVVQNRDVDFEILVEVGPAIANPREPGAIPMRMIAARVRDPMDGRVLHNYTIAAETKDAAASNSRPAALMSGHQLAFWALRSNPELLTDERAKELARQQIQKEKYCFDTIARLTSQDMSYQRIDPRNPVYTFEWADLKTKRPDLVESAVLPLFRSTKGDWSFINTQPGYDPRFNHIVDAFVFSSASLNGRDATFAASELFDVYRQHTLAAAQKPQDYFQIVTSLQNLNYDIQTESFQFPPQRTGEAPPRIALMQPAQYGPYEGLSDLDLRTIDYGRVIPEETQNPGYSYGCAGDQSPAANWRKVTSGLIFSANVNQMVAPILGVDRDLTLAAIRVPRAAAEQFSRNSSYGLQASIKFQIVKVTVVPEPKHFTKKAAIYSARLDAVDITDRNGNILRSIPPSEFDTAAAAQEKARVAAVNAAALAVKAKEDAERAKAEEKARIDRERASAQAAAQKSAIDDFITRSVRPAEPFGLEVQGVRLGLSLAAADDIVRKSMAVKYSVGVAPSTTSLAQAVSGSSGLLNGGRIYVNADFTKVITVYTYEPVANDRVVAVAAWIELPNANIQLNDLAGELAKEYGQPAATTNGVMGWYKDSIKCAPSMPVIANYRVKPRLDQDGRPIMNGMPLSEDEALQPARATTRFDVGAPELPDGLLDRDPKFQPMTQPVCGTALFARVHNGGLLLTQHDKLWLDAMFYESARTQREAVDRAVQGILKR